MFYERFAELCAENQKSQAFVVQSIGLNRAAIAKWKKGSIPNGDTVRKLAEFFGVSTDYLLGNVNEPFFYLDNKRILNEINSLEEYNEEKPAPESRNGLSIKEQKDIAKKVDAFMASLENEKDLMFDGDPASDEALEDLRRAITVGYEMARIKNREKYNPYKNKNKK